RGIGSSASRFIGSLTSADPEGPSNTQDPGLVTDLQAMEDDSITRLQHVITHKWQETDSWMGTLNVSVQVPHHKSGTTSNNDPTLNGQASCPITPCSVRDLLSSRPFTPISFISRGLSTFRPSHSSTGVLSSSLVNNATTGTPRSLISADGPPASPHNQRRLIELEAHKEDDNAANLV
ncbi:hypothetical protein PQX77_021468, partial [Marasmius sp. AFHP31]